MTDLTPEGLRARAAKIVGDYNSDDSPHDGEIMGRYEHRLVSRIAVAFTTLVAEARLTVLQEVNQLACDGLSSSLSIKGMLAMHDRRVVAEARRAQREEDCRAVCSLCRDLGPSQEMTGSWVHGYREGIGGYHCSASPICAQEETP